jgi:iron complex outermembrane receptor protein
MQKSAHLGVAVMAACSMELAAGTAHAQEAASGTKQPARVEPADLETITVTGSLLPTAPDAVAVPVIAIDAKQLEQNGVTTNALEMLRKAIPSFAGRSNAGTSNANNDNQRTAGGSQL